MCVCVCVCKVTESMLISERNNFMIWFKTASLHMFTFPVNRLLEISHRWLKDISLSISLSLEEKQEFNDNNNFMI